MKNVPPPPPPKAAAKSPPVHDQSKKIRNDTDSVPPKKVDSKSPCFLSVGFFAFRSNEQKDC